MEVRDELIGSTSWEEGRALCSFPMSYMPGSVEGQCVRGTEHSGVSYLIADRDGSSMPKRVVDQDIQPHRAPCTRKSMER